MTAPDIRNREEWLMLAAEALGEILVEADHELVPLRVSVGWPGGRGPKTSVRGQCWASTSTEDGVAQIFISPNQNDTVTTLAVLLHEVVHAVDDCSSGHNGNFIKVARSVGFLRKWTTSDNRTPELTKRLTALAETLGDFPHAPIVTGKAADTPAKQGTRMLKVICPVDDYTVRTTRKWLDVGTPTCPCGEEMEEEIK